MKKFYLTTPLYYPNARPHVGNSYTTIVCDAIARYKRLCGHDVAFLTGTDEHGEKLQRAAVEAGVSPAEFVASKRELFHSLWKQLNISYSHFIYTDLADHTRSVQRMLLRARANGYIDKRRYEGRYCVSDERYISDGTEPANCDICGRPAELISEENYFFKLSEFEKPLLDLYERHRKDPRLEPFVQPPFRLNEVVSFVRSGLRDISVSRKRIKWGIPWPDDPEQVFYVWYDALTGYLTGIGYAEGENGSSEFQKYWPADIHMVGKDIIRFHAVYWPAFLMAAELPLPRTIFAHGWLTVGADKMSKSKGNVVYCEPIVEALGADALRYYLMRDIPFGQDSSFTYEGLIQRYNSDLANDLGNLANRVIAMINRYFGGEVPQPVMGLTHKEEKLKGEFFGGGYQDGTLYVAGTAGLTREYELSFGRFQLNLAAGWVWNMVSMVNGYLVEQQPWKLAESDREEDRSLLALVLYTAADLLRTMTILLYPIIPDSSKRLWEQLGQKGELGAYHIDELKWGGLAHGTRVGKPEPIFPRVDKEKTLAKLYELAEADRERDKPKAAALREAARQPDLAEADRARANDAKEEKEPVGTPTEQKISIEDFAKVEMRVGEVKSAEPVQGAQKLMKLAVDIGSEVRQVVAGIAEYYKPEQLIGMKVVIVTNLQPRKLRGVESNGMVVAATVGEEGRPVLVTFKEDVPNGARLK
jgi:methionyl-tRNA synthetase